MDKSYLIEDDTNTHRALNTRFESNEVWVIPKDFLKSKPLIPAVMF